MSSQSTNDGQHDAHRHVRAGHRPRHARRCRCRTASRARCRACREEVRRIGVVTREDLAGHPDGRAAHLAGRRATTRCTCRNFAAAARPRRAGARRRASATCIVFGRRRLQHARLARPAEARRARPDGRRRGRAPSASRTCRSPPASSASSPTPAASAFQLAGQRAGPAHRRRSSSATSSSRPASDGEIARAARRRPRRARRAASYALRSLLDNQAGGRASRSSRLPAPTRSSVADAVRATMAELKQGLPAGHRVPHRLRPDDLRARVDRRTCVDDAARSHRPGRARRAVFLQSWRASLIPLVAVPGVARSARSRS